MYGYVYKTTNLVNNKIYIGQHKKSYFDTHYFGSGTQLLRAIEKYSLKAFRCDLIEACDTADELSEREIFWIAYFNSRDPDIGYNISEGGNVNKGFTQSEHQKAVVSKRNSYKRSAEIRLNMSIAAKKRTLNRRTNDDKIWATDGKEEFLIDKSDIDKYEKQGFITSKRLPRSSAYRQEMREKYDAGCYIHKDGKNKFISDEELNQYLTEGWTQGKVPYTQEHGDNISKAKRGAIAVTDGAKTYYVQPDQLAYYLDNGFIKGRGPYSRKKK